MPMLTGACSALSRYVRKVRAHLTWVAGPGGLAQDGLSARIDHLRGYDGIYRCAEGRTSASVLRLNTVRPFRHRVLRYG